MESAENIDDNEELLEDEEGEIDMYGDEDGELQLEEGDDESGRNFDDTESEPEATKSKKPK